MSDAVKYRLEFDVRFVPAGCLALLPDGSTVRGPVFLESPPRWVPPRPKGT